MTDRLSFFPTHSEDQALEVANATFWETLLAVVEEDRDVRTIESVLDVGCHSGALLDCMAKRWNLHCLYGIEPVASLRRTAVERLSNLSLETLSIVGPERWHEVADGSIDLVISQEVLYLVEDVAGLFRHIARVLVPTGAAYVTLGCHTENPLWPRWREVLVGMGLTVYDYAPMDILRHAESAGLWTALRPLRRDGWIIHTPSAARFPVPDVTALMDHHYRHKLLFRLEK